MFGFGKFVIGMIGIIATALVIIITIQKRDQYILSQDGGYLVRFGLVGLFGFGIKFENNHSTYKPLSTFQNLYGFGIQAPTKMCFAFVCRLQKCIATCVVSQWRLEVFPSPCVTLSRWLGSQKLTLKCISENLFTKMMSTWQSGKVITLTLEVKFFDIKHKWKYVTGELDITGPLACLSPFPVW